MSESSPTLSETRQATASTLDAVQALRAATHDLHQQLDTNLPVGRDGATLSDYANHLLVIREWQLALQPWLSRTSSNTDSLALIAQDLVDCAGVLTPGQRPLADLAPVRRADDGSLAFCWGMAYVLEGSRLGGQVLYRRLREPLSPHPLRYLGERNTGGPSWPDVLKTLRAELPTDTAQASACLGAVAAFGLLLAQFRQAEVLA